MDKWKWKHSEERTNPGFSITAEESFAEQRMRVTINKTQQENQEAVKTKKWSESDQVKA